MKHADLHMHTHFSDGTDSPQEVVKEAHERGLSCIAITDHDTVDGIEQTIKEGQKVGLEVITGIELSSEINGKDIHMLGYLFDYRDSELIEKISHMQDARVSRMEEMIEKLKSYGINNITLKEVCELAKSRSVGRPHLAIKLVEKGWVKTIKEAFDEYLAEGAKAYVPKFKQTPQEAIDLIRKAGGVASLAHPMITKVDELIPGFVKAGMGALEVYYPNCGNSIISFYKGIADKYQIAATGGSDAHGKAKKNTYIGKATIDYETVEKLKEAVHAS